MSDQQRRDYNISRLTFQLAALHAIEKIIEDQGDQLPIIGTAGQLHHIATAKGYTGPPRTVSGVLRLLELHHPTNRLQISLEMKTSIEPLRMDLLKQLDASKNGIPTVDAGYQKITGQPTMTLPTGN